MKLSDVIGAVYDCTFGNEMPTEIVVSSSVYKELNEQVKKLGWRAGEPNLHGLKILNGIPVSEDPYLPSGVLEIRNSRRSWDSRYNKRLTFKPVQEATP